MAKEIVSGLGTRYGVVFELESTTGLPLPASSSAVPTVGVEIWGIQGMTGNPAAVRRIVHRGGDRPYITDTLPPNENDSFTITTDPVNFQLDNLVEDTATRSFTASKARAEVHSNRGNEPQVMAFVYRQAMDADPNSVTHGKLRQWEARSFHSARIMKQQHDFAEEATTITYEGTPTEVTYTFWNERLTSANWGVTRATSFAHTFDYHPRINAWRGNGTLTAFQLSHPPVTSTSLDVWVDGTLTVPSSVVTTAANPAFTLGAAPADAKLVLAIVQTNAI